MRKGFCVAPFRNSEFFHDGKVWQCVSGEWSEEEKRWVNAWITCGPSGNALEDDWDDIWNGEVSQKLRQSMPKKVPKSVQIPVRGPVRPTRIRTPKKNIADLTDTPRLHSAALATRKG